MTIAVLSGKGGTGKTLVSVNLAYVAGRAVYIDCDVEEPNGRLFLKPADVSEEDVAVKIPSVDAALCTGCRKCVDFCRFNALAFIKSRPYVFEEVCHSCGGCTLLCTEKALSERDRTIGRLERGVSGNITVATGILNAGEVSGIPVIRKLLREYDAPESGCVFIDCPPGSACSVMESIRDADFCLLVAEPTLFGVHNLQMVCELVRLFKKPFGAVLNKCLDGENPAETFCMDNGIKVLGKIPFDQELGTITSNAEIAAASGEKYSVLFRELLDAVVGEARG